MDNKTEANESKIPESNSLQQGWSKLGIATYIKIIILGSLFCFIFQNEILDIVRKWVSDPSWSHGFLIPFFSLYFIDQHRKEILELKTRPSYLGLLLLLACLVFYPLNIVHFQYGYLRPLNMIACLGCIFLFLGGWKLIRYLWLPVGFLVFAVPLPQRIYVAVTMPMRKLAAIVAASLLNFVEGLDATANGVVIDVVYHGKVLEPALNVAEACSGMRLLMAFLALGVAMAYLHYRPIWQRIVLLMMTVPIAVFCNIIRVTVTGFIYILISPKYAQGIYHDMLGILMLPLAFGLYGLIAWLMSDLVVDAEDEVEEDIIFRKTNQ